MTGAINGRIVVSIISLCCPWQFPCFSINEKTCYPRVSRTSTAKVLGNALHFLYEPRFTGQDAHVKVT
uniref:Uncharacterized protein n=1 Tax=Rhizophagus irregularis (strain DAOM 181602 / DAOM 197198 / MUCL 43194) TaxID=747089 RepID=U9T408_RHIID